MLLRRAANEPQLLRRLYYRQEGLRVQSYERRTASQFASHITCSDLDSQRLLQIAPQAHTVAIPNGVDTGYFRPGGSSAGKGLARRSIIFVGSLNWYPNVSAVEYLLREIWPLVKRSLPDLTLDIVGSAPPRAILELAAPLAGVTVHGYVDDVRPLMDAACSVCPSATAAGPS